MGTSTAAAPALDWLPFSKPELIHTCYAAAYEDKDFRTMQFLDWFVKEQGEEEKNASDLISRFELFGHDAKGLYDLDAEYKTRTYIAPSIL